MLDKTIYLLLNFIARILSIFPFVIIYGISNILSIIAYRVVGYRRKVVRTNLNQSFPEKTTSEIVLIEKQFYRYFTDYFMETLMVRYLSENRLRKHFVFKNIELVNSYFENKRSIILVTAHFGSFEMSSLMPKFIKHKIMAVYKPQSNKGFDKFFVKLRERFGIEAVPMNIIAKKLFQETNQDIPTITYLLSDQRPLRKNIGYWTIFLNQDTPVLLGPEKLSVKYNHALFYLNIVRIKRGYFEATFELIEDKPQSTAEFEITEKQTRHLENLIKSNPSTWFWAHKRWKHSRFPDVVPV